VERSSKAKTTSLSRRCTNRLPRRWKWLSGAAAPHHSRQKS